MSFQSDAEIAVNVQVGGTDRSALFYNDATSTWYTKDQAGTIAPLVSVAGVSSFGDSLLTGAVGSTLATAEINPATTALKGAQSAIDKAKEDNMYYDVEANTIAGGQLVGDDLTDNSAAWVNFFAGLPVGALVFFPAGTYRTSTSFPISADKHLRIIGAGMYSTTIKTITSTTANIFHINGSYWYNSFENLRFDSVTTKTAGAAIAIDPGSSGSAVGTNIRNCSFVNQFIAINAQGSQAANLSVWEGLDIASTPVNGRGILINGDTINLIISDSTINCGYPPFQVAGTACIEVNQSGAIQLVGGEFIGGINTLLLNANQGGTTSVAAVLATNCFFDQSGGSTVKITGANIVNRCKFVQCGITGGNIAGAVAVEISSSGTGAAGTATAAADGIDFFDCDIYPNGGSGTMNGFQITGAQGVAINACRISGWTNGITVTPVASNGYTKIFVTSNKLGATNNFTTPNTVGLVLNAGAFTYGAVVVTGNDFQGSTTPLVEGATVTYAYQEFYDGNVGITGKQTFPTSTSTQAVASGGTGIIVGGSIPVPINGLRVGNTFRWIVPLQKTGATGTSLTFGVKFGVNNSAADANVATAAFTGTGVADSGMLTVSLTVLTLGATATAVANFYINHGGTTTGLVSTIAGVLVNGTMSTFNSGATNGYFNIAITANTATVLNIFAPVTGEILR